MKIPFGTKSPKRAISSRIIDDSFFHLLSCFYSHPHSVLWPQRDQRLETDLLFRNQLELPFSGERREKQNALGPRKAFADTTANAASKREVYILLSGLFNALRFPALGDELICFFPETCVALSDVRTHENESAFRYGESAELMLLDRQSSYRPGRRKQAHGLCKNGLRVFKTLNVVDRWRY